MVVGVSLDLEILTIIISQLYSLDFEFKESSRKYMMLMNYETDTDNKYRTCYQNKKISYQKTIHIVSFCDFELQRSLKLATVLGHAELPTSASQ